MFNLHDEAKKIAKDVFNESQDKGLDGEDIINLYERIIGVAKRNAESIQYEAEQKIDALTEVNCHGNH